MSVYICPFCGTAIPDTLATKNKKRIAFDPVSYQSALDYHPSMLEMTFYKCPECENFSIHVEGQGDNVAKINTWLQPISQAKQFPEYIPKIILDDYEEAYAILNLSPKASATLSRRCLQSMIRDFWEISKSRLVDEIVALAEDDKVPAEQRQILHALRNIGNIGAHPEANVNLIIDINSDDAEKLLKIIELFIKQWYINRHEQQALFDDVSAIANSVTEQKKK